MSEAGGSVFVSYRREGSGDAAGRLADRLVDRLGAERVFMDVDAIEPGMDYVDAITRAVDACDVLVAVIGPGWLTAADKRGRRLDDPYDWVRVEVGTALARNVRVIPVLVGGALMPTRDELPEDLAGLARRNALRIRHESFRADAGRLVAVVERVLAPALPAVAGAAAAIAAGDVPNGATRPDVSAATENANRAGRLLLQAERIANSITAESERVWALSWVAKAVAATHPDRAARLFDDAERVASSLGDDAGRAVALKQVVMVAASTDPGRAERVTNSITDESQKRWALSDVAGAVAATDPGRAAALFGAAEQIASSAAGENDRAAALGEVARAAAATDLGRAERIAAAMTDGHPRDYALKSVAEAVAATDPDRAERIASSITRESARASALAAIAAALSST